MLDNATIICGNCGVHYDRNICCIQEADYIEKVKCPLCDNEETIEE